jgi:hypothetical protein
MGESFFFENFGLSKLSVKQRDRLNNYKMGKTRQTRVFRKEVLIMMVDRNRR